MIHSPPLNRYAIAANTFVCAYLFFDINDVVCEQYTNARQLQCCVVNGYCSSIQ